MPPCPRAPPRPAQGLRVLGGRGGTLALSGETRSDLFIDPSGEGERPEAGYLLAMPPRGDFTLVARITVRSRPCSTPVCCPGDKGFRHPHLRGHRAGVSLARSDHLPRPGVAGPFVRCGSAAPPDITNITAATGSPGLSRPQRDLRRGRPRPGPLAAATALDDLQGQPHRRPARGRGGGGHGLAVRLHRRRRDRPRPPARGRRSDDLRAGHGPGDGADHRRGRRAAAGPRTGRTTCSS